MSKKKSHQVPTVVRVLARTFLTLSGWKAVGSFEGTPKCVVIAQHTSNWDGAYGVAGALALDARIRWLGKDSLFKGWKGKFMILVGGIPVDRSKRHNMVDQAVKLFEEYETLILGITPEGTRKKTQHWKTGFYYIALQANVPIWVAFIDYRRKEVGPGLLIYPSGDIHADLDTIREFLKDKTPCHPEQASEIRIQDQREPIQ